MWKGSLQHRLSQIRPVTRQEEANPEEGNRHRAAPAGSTQALEQ